MKKIRNNQQGFSVVEVVLILVIVVLIGVVGWMVYKNHHKDVASSANAGSTTKSVNTSKTSINNPVTATKSSSPTANWTSFTSQDGKFSLKYPSSWTVTTNCPSNQFDAGPTSSSAGVCNNNGNSNPEITIADTVHGCFPPASGSYSTQQVTVSGTSSKEYRYSSGATTYIEYCIPPVSGSNLSYEASYTQQAGYPDVSSDFDLLVTKTFRFN